MRPSPPSEPCVQISRTRLSNRWIPDRDWQAKPSHRSVSNHVVRPDIAFSATTAYRAGSGLRLLEPEARRSTPSNRVRAPTDR